MATAKKISLRQARGSAMSELLNPTKGYRGSLEKKGIKPKNHHSQNIRALRERQQQNRALRADKEAEQRRQLEAEKTRLSKFKGVKSAVAANLSKDPKKGHQFLRKQTAIARSTSIAGAARESRGAGRRVKTKPPVPSAQVEYVDVDAEVDRGLTMKKPKNYLAANRMAAGMTKSRAPKAMAAPTNRNFGKIPDYILERKIELEKKKEQERQASKKSKVPPGMILVPEEERLETLAKLRSGKQQINKEILRLPLVVETLTRKRAKKALEDKMKEIDEAIKVFSQKQVFIEE